MKAQASSPQTTLLILLGASEWPLFPEFQDSKAFANAARGVKNYFLDPNGFGIPSENVFDAFNSDSSNDELDRQIGQFLEQRLSAMKATRQDARDLLVYFVGHGGFIGRDSDFYLAIRRTRAENPRVSGIAMQSLADTVTEKARSLRRIIILDCCFAAAAFSAFQAGPSQVALEKTKDAFEVKQRGGGFPTRGTTLLCSSSQKSPSLLLPDGSSTMFTKAVLDALAEGITSQQDRLSLREVKNLAADLLYGTRNAPTPVVLSPDQSEGDIADIPFFPNSRVEEEKHHQAFESDSQLLPPADIKPHLTPTHPHRQNVIGLLFSAIGLLFSMIGVILAFSSLGQPDLHLFPAGVANLFLGLMVFFIAHNRKSSLSLSTAIKRESIIGVFVGAIALLFGIGAIIITAMKTNGIINDASGGTSAGVFTIIAGVITLWSMLIRIRK
jgi:hypothetical protein